MNAPREADLAAALRTVLGLVAGDPALRRLRVRLRELGDNARDEVQQFKLLQRACRESPALVAALRDAGLGDPTTVDPRNPKSAGALVQAFNRMVETWWEE